jgi:replicative DNA helicase
MSATLHLQTELEVLGALLRHPDQIPRVDLEPADFGRAENQAVFAALRGCVADGVEVDPLNVAARTGMPDMGAQNGLAYVATLWKDTVGSVHALPGRVESIRAASRARKFRELIDAARTHLDQKPDKADATRARLLLRLAELDAPGRQYDHDAAHMMRDVCDLLDEIAQAQAEGRHRGIPTGIEDLDQALGGLYDTDLTVIAGRPGMGKTAMMLKLTDAAALAGFPVGLISAEMPAKQLGLRLAGMAAGIAPDRMRRGMLKPEEYQAITRASAAIAKLPIRTFDRPSVTPSDIAIQARAWKLSCGLRLLIVDYLQRIVPDRKLDSQDQEIGSIAAAMKNLARTLGIPVVVLAAVNRQCELRADKRPTMADLRGSGVIEFEADQVLFLYRDTVYNPSADASSAEIIIDKNRHGPCRTVAVRFDEELMRFRGVGDIGPAPYQAPVRAVAGGGF